MQKPRRKVDKEVVKTLKGSAEPALAGESFVYSTSSMIDVFNWYSGYRDVKACRPWVVEYMQTHGYSEDEVSLYELSETWRTSITMCTIARMINKGCDLSPGQHENFLKDRIAEVLKKTDKPIVVEIQPKIDTSAVDLLLDEFFKNNYKQPKEMDAHQVHIILATEKVKGYHASHLIRYLRPLLAELEDDEKSAHLTKRQRSNYREFGAFLIDAFRAYDKEAPKVRSKPSKPRKKKFKTAESLVAKAKYKTEDKELGLTGTTPERIVGARIAWIFNTRYMKLSKCVAPEGTTLSFKGTTIQNLDEDKSVAKRVSKMPKLKEILETTPARAARLFELYRGTEQAAPGRLNEDTLIVRIDR